MAATPSNSLPIVIKHGATTFHLHLNKSEDSQCNEQFESIARHIRIPSDRLKLIYKGKKFTRDNWHELTLISNMTFLSVGEQNEDESDVNSKDVECIMKQLHVERNDAVRALKLHSNVIDAILYLGNK